jgi:putative membrane protein
MGNELYSRYEREPLILRDHLAVERTVLANERTLLAYLRAALSLFVSGIAFLKIPFFASALFIYTGWVFIPLSLVVVLIGWVRYKRTKNRISTVREREPGKIHAPAAER